MPEYIFAYHGGEMPETEEEGAKMMERWNIWMQGLGDALVEPGNPVGKSWTVSADGVEANGGSNPLSGYSVVSAESMEAAAEMAKGCPHVDSGTVELAEIIPM
ncbi:MAG: YciI family protein [Rhizobiaceae bacterium]